MSMKSIRERYGVPAKRGAKIKIKCSWDPEVYFQAVIVSSQGNLIGVKMNGLGHKPTLFYHPGKNITYL